MKHDVNGLHHSQYTLQVRVVCAFVFQPFVKKTFAFHVYMYVVLLVMFGGKSIQITVISGFLSLTWFLTKSDLGFKDKVCQKNARN